MAYNFVRANSQHLIGSLSINVYPCTISYWGNAAVNTLALGALSISDSTGNEALRSFFAGNIAGDPVQNNTIDNGVGGTASSSLSGFSVNTWHHVGATFSSSTSRITYLDGVAGTENTVSSDPTGLITIVIGAIMISSTPAARFDGLLSEFGVWNTVLTDAEIISLSKGFSPKRIRPQSLEFYAPLINNTANYIAGTILSNQNSPTVTSHNRIYL